MFSSLHIMHKVFKLSNITYRKWVTSFVEHQAVYATAPLQTRFVFCPPGSEGRGRSENCAPWGLGSNGFSMGCEPVPAMLVSIGTGRNIPNPKCKDHPEFDPGQTNLLWMCFSELSWSYHQRIGARMMHTIIHCEDGRPRGNHDNEMVNTWQYHHFNPLDFLGLSENGDTPWYPKP